MPFRASGLDVMDRTLQSSPGPEFPRASSMKGTEMVTLIDPILGAPSLPEGIELPPLHQPASMVTDRVAVEAVKRDKRFDWTGSRSGLRDVVRQLETYGWTVTAREESAHRSAPKERAHHFRGGLSCLSAPRSVRRAVAARSA
jgi:hypothetical protein